MPKVAAAGKCAQRDDKVHAGYEVVDGVLARQIQVMLGFSPLDLFFHRVQRAFVDKRSKPFSPGLLKHLGRVFTRPLPMASSACHAAFGALT
jgi:hypothetical protein